MPALIGIGLALLILAIIIQLIGWLVSTLWPVMVLVGIGVVVYKLAMPEIILERIERDVKRSEELARKGIIKEYEKTIAHMDAVARGQE